MEIVLSHPLPHGRKNELLNALADRIRSDETSASSETKDRQTASDAARYRWLRDDALQWLLSGPICVRADKWGKPLLEYVGGNPEHGPSIHITLDGKELDAEIDDAIARRNAALTDEGEK